VAVVEALRRREHDVSLTLIGHHDDLAYERHLEELASSRPWFRVLYDLSREELVREIAAHRYGIHTMQDEHFGIAPAEILSAGCLPFVHNSGGPVEIVAGEPHLTFDTVEEAAGKIERVLSDRDLECRLLNHVAAGKARFTADAFCAGLREIIRHFA
jgi:glycosyltransferase involved in cell wall biosynthesis